MSTGHDDDFSKERAIVRLEEMYRFSEGDPPGAPEGDLSRRRYVDAVLAASETYVSGASRESRGRRILLAAAGAAAAAGIAAAVLSVVALRDPGAPGGEPTRRGVAAEAPSFRVVAGNLTAEAIEGEGGVRRIEPDERIAVGGEGALFSVGGGIAVLAGSGARLRMRADAGRIDIDLEEGAILAHVDPASRAPGLVVTAPGTSVEVTGTVLSVSADRRGVEVAVYRGSVDVGRGASRMGLGAGTALGADGSLRPIGKECAARVLAGADGLLGLSQGLEPGDLALADLRDLLGCAGAGPAGEAAPIAVAGAVAAPTAGQLLEAAREARKERDWSAAAGRYRELIRRYPGAGEAGVALVDLGTIELDMLGRPARALASFDGYLARGGTLAAEALWGKANALRALGRGAEERAALEEIVASHPDAFQALEARRRLGAPDPAAGARPIP